MANFKTHKDISIIISVLIAVTFFFIWIVDFSEIFYLVIVWMIAGLLPDLDHSETIQNYILFNIIWTITVSLIFMMLFENYVWYKVFFIMLIAFFFIVYVLRYIYNEIVVHRWMFHSIPTALLFSIVTINIFHSIFWVLFEKSLMIWLFVFIGYILHLVLDEIYSVDLFNVRLKRSFWTALKFYSKKYVLSSVTVYILLFSSMYYLPDSAKIIPLIIDLYENYL